MELPALLPEELRYTAEINDDDELFEALVDQPQEFILFFEFASDDETWSDRHSRFMKQSIEWMSQQFFEDKLLAETAQRAVVKIREHYTLLLPHTPKNLSFQINGTEKSASSLMWGGSSEFLRSLIRRECRDKETTKLEIGEVPSTVFDQIEEYVTTGDVKNLWSREKDEVIELLEQADGWGLTALVELCQDHLQKFIGQGNAIELLIQAHEENWLILKDSCIDFINDLDVEVRFEKSLPEVLAMEFLEFNDTSMEVFERARYHVTHLICSGDLPSEPGFSDVINRCPRMVCLNISRSNAYTDRFLDIPDTLAELDISKCEWLSNKTLQKIAGICPNLVKIGLGSNAQLNYSSWGILNKLDKLSKLDISRCYQVGDEDFKLILQACSEITHLWLIDCSGLTDMAFFELGKQAPDLTDLDVSGTKITERGLIDLVVRCSRLITLRARRCPNLAAEAFLEVVQNSPSLQILDINHSDMNDAVLRQIRDLRPFLEIVR